MKKKAFELKTHKKINSLNYVLILKRLIRKEFHTCMNGNLKKNLFIHIGSNVIYAYK